MGNLQSEKPIRPSQKAIEAFKEHDLHNAKNWVCYGYTKNPINTLKLWRSGTSDSYKYGWGTLAKALMMIGQTAEISDKQNADGTYATHKEKVIGVGIILKPELKLNCIDLDHCVSYGDNGDMIIEPYALEIIRYFDSYSEISASGTGIHVLFIGDAPKGHRKQVETDKDYSIEFYSSDHHIAITGRLIDGYDRIKVIDKKHIAEFYNVYMAPYVSAPVAYDEKAGIKNCQAITPNIEAIINHKPEELQRILNRKKKVYKTMGAFTHDLYTFPLSDFLGLPEGCNIFCPFHEDEHESASIYKTPQGRYILHCHAENRSWSIVQVVERLGDFRYKTQAIDFIKTALKMEVRESEQCKRQKQELQFILDMCDSLDEFSFKEQCPDAYKCSARGMDILRALLLFIRDNTFDVKYGNSNKIIFYMTADHLTQIMYTDGNKKSGRAVYEWLQVFKYLDIIRQLPDDEIPDALLQKAIRLYGGKGKRHTSFYEIRPWVDLHLRKMDEQGAKFKRNKYTKKTIGYEAVEACEGEAVARSIYTQAAKDGRKIATISKNGNKAAADRAELIERLAIGFLQDNGYFMECMILDAIRETGATESEINRCEVSLKRHRGELQDKYSLVKVKAGKALKAKYNIDVDGYPWIWIQQD